MSVTKTVVHTLGMQALAYAIARNAPRGDHLIISADEWDRSRNIDHWVYPPIPRSLEKKSNRKGKSNKKKNPIKYKYRMKISGRSHKKHLLKGCR